MKEFYTDFDWRTQLSIFTDLGLKGFCFDGTGLRRRYDIAGQAGYDGNSRERDCIRHQIIADHIGLSGIGPFSTEHKISVVKLKKMFSGSVNI